MSSPLFPPIEPYETGFLRVDDIHRLYWEASGNPKGAPVVFLHGGPGAGCDPVHRRYFDPEHYRIILFDQRGARRSTPLGETRNNSPSHLVRDIEALREALGVDRWILFGGSWGSTLALLYAQAHRVRCAGLILRGVSLFEREELRWWFHGMGRFFPELWEDFAGAVPEGQRDDLARAYTRLLDAPEEDVRLRALKAIHTYAHGCGSFRPMPVTDDLESPQISGQLLAFYRLFLYYTRHHRLEEGALLKGLVGLRGIVVQGRYDVICPPVMAHRLHLAWREARYVLVPDAGHSSLEASMAQALREATDSFRELSL